jgi:hypothetical protein
MAEKVNRGLILTRWRFLAVTVYLTALSIGAEPTKNQDRSAICRDYIALEAAWQNCRRISIWRTCL